MFRVLLQPGLGCCVGFCCTHDIETGDAGQVIDVPSPSLYPKLSRCLNSKIEK